jgi:hypothetical protein
MVLRLNLKQLRDLIEQIEAGGGDASMLRQELEEMEPVRNYRPRARRTRPGLDEEEELTTAERLNHRVGDLFDGGISDDLLNEIIEMDRNHTLKELKELCCELSLSPNGDKKELAAKLLAYNKPNEKLPQTVSPTGTCYQDAWRFLIKEEEGDLVHGTVQTIGKRIKHAWVELPTGYIWEPESGEYLKKEYFYERALPEVDGRYNYEEAAVMLARTKNFGPWTKEEESYLERVK